MGKDFDSDWAERKSVGARTFNAWGETFILKTAVRPETFDVIDDPKEGDSLGETFAKIDAQFIAMIEPGDGDEAITRYLALRERDDVVGVRDLQEVLAWMLETQTGRPPTSHDASSPGRTRTGTRSTAASSSRVLREA